MRHSLLIIIANTLLASAAWALPDGFVYIDQEIPGIRVNLLYASSNNFVGRPINGYVSKRAVLTKPAARALADVQADLKPFGLELFIFDTYRPQRAVDEFITWAKDLKDIRTKAKYYPRVAKENLFSEGYIADRSGHSRGSTIDLTIVSSSSPFKPLNMGTNFDFFGPESWPKFAGATPEQRANRLLLRTLMLKHGFKPYEMEWWHFTYEKEPFPDTYFDFVVD
jgi:D-alanyl-D-alanine dipeptidase